jgi:Fe-S-cluster-containing dehydrogenase component
VRVCPTQATWKRDDGIVMMDMHRCIGCRYCMAACPYGSRSFNWKNPWENADGTKQAVPNPQFPTRTRGVVEKCNLCSERLARGEIPKCVEACRHGALTFGDASDPTSEVRKLLASRYSIRRKVHLGTEPHVFYLV